MSLAKTSNLEAPENKTPKAPAKFSSWRFQRSLTPYLFLSPFLLAFIVFMIYPLLYALNLSMYRKKIIGGVSFVGLDNYVKAFHDKNFWEGIRNVLTFGAMQIPVMLGLALLFALLLDGKLIRRQTIFRLGYFLPFAVPSVVAALIWGYFYGQSFGPIAQVAKAMGLQPPLFLTPKGIIPSIANIATWQYTGYNMLILFAALKGIPEELYDSARVDGASEVQIALQIRIPLILPAIVLTAIFSIIGTLQLFNEPNILQVVAPTVMGSHFTPNIYVYSLAFGNRQFDYSAAIAFALAIVTAVLSSIVLLTVYRRQQGD